MQKNPFTSACLGCSPKSPNLGQLFSHFNRHTCIPCLGSWVYREKLVGLNDLTQACYSVWQFYMTQHKTIFWTFFKRWNNSNQRNQFIWKAKCAKLFSLQEFSMLGCHVKKKGLRCSLNNSVLHWRCPIAKTSSKTICVSVWQMPAEIQLKRHSGLAQTLSHKSQGCAVRDIVSVFMLNICNAVLAFPVLASHL